MSVQIIQGDCREAMKSLDDCSVDAIVTDPPYGLGFMGKDWDHGVPGTEFWQEMLRVMKPGAHLLAFGGSRTYHRMTCAIEDSGFEIRDCIMWLYGSGFPKSHNGPWGGTALKPAHEPIVLARKPLEGTVAQNVAKHGTGAINIDGCRIEFQGDADKAAAKPGGKATARGGNLAGQSQGGGERAEFNATQGAGRWPANVIHDGSDTVLAAFPDAKGQQGKVTGNEPTGNGFSGSVMYGGFIGRRESASPRIEADKSAARFFYCAKASRSERNAGLDELPDVPGGMVSNTSGQHITRRDGGAPGPTKNNHPTVKPIALMRYLCRLATPQGGTILDPFMGSGSTGCAATLEGFNFIGIERDPAYVHLAEHRIAYWLMHGNESESYLNQLDMWEAAS